jgi:hypothetical protein
MFEAWRRRWADGASRRAIRQPRSLGAGMA